MPISRITVSTVLPAMTTPRSARRRMATCLGPQPFAVREKISPAASQSSGLAGAFGCDIA